MADPPYLTKFTHRQEAESGGANDSSFNGLVDDIPRQLLIGLRPEGQDISVTATSYPGTPDFRFPVRPWAGQYLIVQVLTERSAGTGNFDIKAEVEGPLATVNTAGTITVTTSGSTPAILKVDISSLGGADRRGEDGWLNIYMKVADGSTTGVLKGFVAMQSSVDANDYLLWAI